MNALLESLLVPEGSSWTYFYRQLDDAMTFNRPWHYHVEVELTLTINSVGQRFVGDSIESYGDGDLVLLGSNLPHTWISQDRIDRQEQHIAHVFWARPGWIDTLTDTLAELRPIKTMLLNANQGIVYSSSIARSVRERVEGMHVLSPAAQLVRFIETLTILAEDREHRLLCAPHPQHDAISQVDRPRIHRTLEYIHKHYRTDISMAHMADLAALSVSGLHRLFKRHTRRTVGEYIAQLRIGRACALLVSTDKPVSFIADEVGYRNLSHFNRQFLAIKQVTPREYRRSFAEKQPQLSRRPSPSAEEPSTPRTAAHVGA